MTTTAFIARRLTREVSRLLNSEIVRSRLQSAHAIASIKAALVCSAARSGRLTTAVLVLGAASAVLSLIHVSPPARAEAIAGATYRGSLSTGGTLILTVSSDGRRLLSLSALDFVLSDCAFDYVILTSGAPLTNQAFIQAAQMSDFQVVFTGTFFPNGTASGTLAFEPSPASRCRNTRGVATWQATTVSLTITPNEAYRRGLNSMAVVGSETSPGIAGKIAELSGLRVDAIWMLSGTQWLFYVPAFSVSSSLFALPGPTAAIFVILS